MKALAYEATNDVDRFSSTTISQEELACGPLASGTKGSLRLIVELGLSSRLIAARIQESAPLGAP